MWRIRHYKVVARVIGDTRRRHAGDAGRGARPADPPVVLPGALAGPERAHRAVAGAADGDGDRCATRQSSSCSGSSGWTRSTRRGTRRCAAELLRDYLAANGVECELLRARAGAREPRRAPARRRRADASRSSATPTPCSPTRRVAARPWSGELVDDEVWGRGALDMKDQVAASAVAFASLAREGFRPPGDLVFVAAADEEVGEGFGLEWLCRGASRRGPRRLRAQRGRRRAGRARRRALYLCATAEKMSAPFLLRVHGRSGHASMPGIADNALVKAARLIERLGAYRPEPRSDPRWPASSTRVLGELPRARATRSTRLRGVDPLAAELVEPLLSLHALADDDRGLRAAERDPGRCEVTVDCRLLPGQHAGGRRAAAPRRARRRRLRARVDRALRRHALAARHPALGRDRGLRRGRSSPARGSRRSAAPASPTPTGCARRSARSRTASSRCGRWIPSSPRG